MKVKEIIHLDMDAFYAAVEVLDNPDLKGKPVIIGGRSKRGVVSTASYEARRYGVHSAMPIQKAIRICPNAIIMPARIARYQEISKEILNIFSQYTPLVEPLALDEAFLDVTGSISLFGSAIEIAKDIKFQIKDEIGLTASAGVSSQKHIAKIASGQNKPNGLTVVPHGEELNFLWALPVEAIWGVGKVTLKKLKDIGILTIKDLAKTDVNYLEKNFGKQGQQIWQFANAIDEREVEPYRLSQSVGSEETYATNLTDEIFIKKEFLTLSTWVARRLRQEDFKAKTISIKIRDCDFKTITRAKTLSYYTNLREDIYETVLNLYEKEKNNLKPIRLLGVTLSQLENKNKIETQPQSLFDDFKENTQKESLNKALDLIANKFGENKIKPATLSNKNLKRNSITGDSEDPKKE